MKPGAERSDEFEVAGRLLTDVGGTIGTEKRKLRFEVEVKEGDRTIGVGTHERRVIEREGLSK